jgi:phospholipase C
MRYAPISMCVVACLACGSHRTATQASSRQRAARDVDAVRGEEDDEPRDAGKSTSSNVRGEKDAGTGVVDASSAKAKKADAGDGGGGIGAAHSGGGGSEPAGESGAAGDDGDGGSAGSGVADTPASAGSGDVSGMSGHADESAGAAAANSGAGGGAGATAGSSGAAGSAGAAAAGSGVAGSAGSPAVCPSAPRPDPKAQQRASCSFAAGAMPTETLDISVSEQAALPIRHVIVMMKENRSYDHYFAQLPLSGQPAAEALPANFSNPDTSNAALTPYHLTTTCLGLDPGHQWQEMHDQVNGGAMDGFVRSAARSTSSDGHFALGYYDATDLPFYYFLASTFALADRYFASVRSGTAPNRLYLLLGTSDGVRASNSGYPGASTPTIFDRLDARAVSWGVYAAPVPFEGALNWSTSHTGLSDIPAFKRALADGTLPSVSFIDSREDIEDEHPTADVQVGEAWTRDIYQAVIASPLWPSIALILTYDEAGGFFDHVAPPNGCVARPQDSAFFELGARVPTVAISAWARHHYVSHARHEHTSILRFIETVFDLPALTARDANSDALLDMFDFTCPSQTPLPTAPPAGSAGCK